MKEYDIIIGDELHEFIFDELRRKTPLQEGMINPVSGYYKTNKGESITLRKKKPEKIICDKTNKPAWYPSFLVDWPGRETIRAGIGNNNEWELIEEITHKSKR